MPLKIFVHLLLLEVIFFTANAQITPKEGSILNYRLAGFSFPLHPQANHYSLEIAKGYFNNADSFKRSIIFSSDSHGNRIITQLPLWGMQYTWRVISSINHSNTEYGELHHFSIEMSPSVDTSKYRLRILKSATQYKDAYILLDNNRVLYDMDGQPLWFLGDLGTLNKDAYQARDMKLSPQGTITLSVRDGGYEVNYNGQIRWHSPDDSIMRYHHEFTRLNNGHYMLLGAEEVSEYLSPESSPGESRLRIISHNETDTNQIRRKHPDWVFYKTEQFPEIVEFDEQKKVAWRYKASKYFNGSDLIFHKGSDGNISTKVHDNSFFLDETRNQLYISFKDISRVIKVSYPDATTLDTYGELFTPGVVQKMGKGFFCGQHSCKCSQDGYLYVLNNNECNFPQLPTVVMMRQPSTDKDSLTKIWEYQCTIAPEENEKKNMQLNSGGNVIELPDRSIFVSMPVGYSKLLIVTNDKQLTWSALPEQWDADKKKWIPAPQYRASIITDRDLLEQFIWSTENQ